MTDKQSAILEATLELVSERGFHGTPMSMVAERADVGAGTIYRYFEGKEDLLTQLYLRTKREMSAAFLVDYREDLSLRDRFRTLWTNMLSYYMHHPRELAFLEQFENSPYATPEVEQAYMEYYQPLARFYHDGVDEGVFKEMPLHMVAVYTLHVAVALAKLHASGTLALDVHLKELAIDACWDALKR